MGQENRECFLSIIPITVILRLETLRLESVHSFFSGAREKDPKMREAGLTASQQRLGRRMDRAAACRGPHRGKGETAGKGS